MRKNDRSDNGKIEKGGYRPLNKGYSPNEQRGYSPKAPCSNLPKPPQGGTGESSKPTSSATPVGGKK